MNLRKIASRVAGWESIPDEVQLENLKSEIGELEKRIDATKSYGPFYPGSSLSGKTFYDDVERMERQLADAKREKRQLERYIRFERADTSRVSAVPPSDPGHCKPCRGTGFDSASLEDCPVCKGTGGLKPAVPTKVTSGIEAEIRKLDEEISQLVKDLEEDAKWAQAAHNNFGTLDQKSFYDQLNKTKEKLADARAKKRRFEMLEMEKDRARMESDPSSKW